MGTKCKTFTKFGPYNKYGTKEYETGDTGKERREEGVGIDNDRTK
jgi:hypothetical protein